MKAKEAIEKVYSMGYDGTLHLDEGLTKSYPPGIFKRYLNMWVLSDPDRAVIDEDVKTCVVVNFSLPKSAHFFEHLLVGCINLHGYVPSAWSTPTIDFEGHAWSSTSVSDIMDISGKSAAIVFEPKFDIELNNIPDEAYHATFSKFLPKILKIGLVPKSKSKRTGHPDRVYFSMSLEAAKNIARQIGADTILKVKLNGIRGLRLFSDPNYFGLGSYTLSNIPPDRIEVL